MTYDSDGNKLKEVSPNLYDASLDDIANHTYSGDHGFRYEYYPNGTLETVTDPENNATTYTYDLYGNALGETKPNGAVYRYEYDVINRLSKVYYKENTTSQEVLLEAYSYTILTGGKLQKTQTKYIDDTKTLVTLYIYDYAGRLIEQDNADSSKLKTSYNANGTVNNTTDGKNNVTYYKYDGLNRLTEKWIPCVNSYSIMYTYNAISYDKAGNKTVEKLGKATVALWSVPTQFITENYTYYKNGKVKSIIDGEGRKTLYYYDDNWNLNRQDTYTDANNFYTTEYTNNHLGKPDEQRVHVRAGDIIGNDFSSLQDNVLTTNYIYDKNGNIKTVTTPDNVITTYTYDNMNRQISVSQPGKDEYDVDTTISSSTTYNWEGNPLTKTDANNNTTVYSYSSRGLLEKVTDAKGGVKAYYYDRAGRMIVEVSPQNYIDSLQYAEMNRIEYAYDPMGRIKTKIGIYQDPVTSQWVTIVSKAYKYDGNGNVVKELDALGYEAGTGTDVDSLISSGYGTLYTYNYANKLIAVKDPVTLDRSLSYTYSYTYDAAGRKTSETNAKGVITNYNYDDAGNVLSLKVMKDIASTEKTIFTKTYDWLGNVKTQVDGNGNMTTIEYNAFNKVRMAVYPGDITIPQKTVIFQYDVTGNLSKQQDDSGVVDLFTYDNQGSKLTHTQKKQDGTESITTSVKYDKNGNERFITDGNNSTTVNIYDGLNLRITEEVTVSGIEHVTVYGYDKNSNLTTQTDWRGNVLTNVYDPLNRLIEKKDAYNKSIQKLEYDHNSRQLKSYDALGNITQYSYDKNNRLLGTIDPENHTTSQTYDNAGNIDIKKDGLNNTTTFTYDMFNRLINVKNAKNENTSYTYDLNNNMLTQTDGKGNITTYEYNVANKLKRKIDDGGRTGAAPNYTYNTAKTECYTYYSDGSLETKTDRNGNTSTYTYDSHGRLISEVAGTTTIAYTYDNNGDQLTLTDGTGTTTRTYDELGRVKTKNVPDVGTTTITYDITTGVNTGCLAKNTTDPKGNVTIKIYDRVGRLGSVTADNKTTTYVYYDNGARQSVVYSDGSREDYTYYDDGTVNTLVNKKANGTVIDSYTYYYDAAHNMTSKVDAKGTTSYTLDTLNRLLTVTEPDSKTTTYAYDAAGNRTSESVVAGTNTTVTTYTYNTQNRLTGTTTKFNNVTTETRTFTYDNNGNELAVVRIPYLNGVVQASQTVLTNTFDKFNQLITSATAGGENIINTYNGEGMRVAKSVNGQATRFLYDFDKVVLELDGNGTQTARNVYGTNLLMRNDGNEQYFYMYNGHGDVTALLKFDGTLAGTYYYDAFGNILETTGTANNYINYAGYQYDKETGLYYCNARMYDPKIARFLSEDTYTGDARDPLSLNLYTYCHNNPIIYCDPTGHWPEWLDKKIEAGKKKIGQIKDAVADTVSDAAKWTVNNVIEPAANFAGGVVVSGVRDLVVDPAVDVVTAVAYVGEKAGLAPKGTANNAYSSLKKGEENIENAIVNNFVTNKAAYYAGRTAGDLASATIGAVAAVQGIGNIAIGGTAMVGGAVTVETVIGPIVLGGGGALVAAAGAAETAYGAEVAWNSFNNGKANFSKIKEAWTEGGSKPKKGQEFRGGSKKQRDNWYGYNDRDFQKWWEKKGKKEWGGADIEDSKMAKEVYDDWVASGKPKVK